MEIRQNIMFLNKLNNNNKANQASNHVTNPMVNFTGLRKLDNDVCQLNFKGIGKTDDSKVKPFNYKTLQTVTNLLDREKYVKGGTGLIRVDYNTPFEEKNGKVIIKEPARIKSTQKTIEYAFNTLKAKNLIIVTHVGDYYDFNKETGKLTINENSSTKQAADFLQKLLSNSNIKVKQTDEVGENEESERKLKNEIANLGEREILVIGNIRKIAAEKNEKFVKTGEGPDATYKKEKDPEGQKALAERLASYGTFFLNEAASASHRDHASFKIGKVMQDKGMPSVAGFDLIDEMKHYARILNPSKEGPLAIVSGGKKVDDKIPALKTMLENNVLKKGDILIIGGGMANTCLVAEGKNIGLSFHQSEKIDDAKALLALAREKELNLILPVDVFAVKAETDSKGKTKLVGTEPVNFKIDELPADYSIVDIGKRTRDQIRETLSNVNKGTIFYNGPMGIAENKKYALGTHAVFDGMAVAKENKSFTMTGGGDTEAIFNKSGRKRNTISFISKCGGAGLDLIKNMGELPVFKYMDKNAEEAAA